MQLPKTFAAFRNPDFRLLWFGAVGSLTGAQMLSLARGYLAYQLTGSAAGSTCLPRLNTGRAGPVNVSRVGRGRPNSRPAAGQPPERQATISVIARSSA